MLKEMYGGLSCRYGIEILKRLIAIHFARHKYRYILILEVISMATKAQLKAQAKYDKKNTQQVVLKLNIKHDADILAKLQNEANKQGYIKDLVRKDMRNLESVLSLDSIKYLLLPIVHRYDIQSVSIFGSYARNEAKPGSDVDLLIDGGNYQGLIEYMNMIDEIRSVLGRNVDVVTQASLDQSRTKADLIFKKNVENERIVLV